MKLNRWLAALAILIGIAMLQVAQRNAVYLKGYSLGERIKQAHKDQTEVAWLETKVLKLTSPDNLSEAAQERNLKLVAWSMLTPEQISLLADDAPAQASVAGDIAASRVPAADSAVQVQLADGHDTTD